MGWEYIFCSLLAFFISTVLGNILLSTFIPGGILWDRFIFAFRMRTQPSFRKKQQALFFILTTRDIYTKQSTFSERSVNIKVRSPWIFFAVLHTLVVTWKQRLLHGIEIAQYFQNYKCDDVGRDRIRKHL